MQRHCKQSLTILGLFLLGLTACTPDKRPLPDVSGVEAPLQVQRFEQDLFQLDTTNFAAALATLPEKYPVFAELFCTRILEAGSLANLTEPQLDFLRGFVTSPVYRAVYDTTQLVYPNLDAITADLQQALRYFRYYFPDVQAPEHLVTFNSAFNYSSIIFGENELAVSLDMFLGNDFDYQRYSPGAPIFSNYLVRTYNKDHLVASVVRVLIDDLVGPAPGDRLLDEMIHNGKKLYLLDQLLPTAADTVKFRVTPLQWTWLQENERNLWSHLLTEDLLYNSRYQDFRKLIEPSPSGAPTLPEESPGEAANYVGFRIVTQFMQRHPELPLGELLLYDKAQDILDQSRYKPARN
jgi:hypothetical protein